VDHVQATTNQTIERYLLGELPEADRDQFEEHYFNCPECAEQVRSVAQLHANIIPVLAEDAKLQIVSVAKKKPSWIDRLRLWQSSPMGAAACLATFLIMTSVIGYQAVEMRRQNAPQAVASVILHPQARGAAAVIGIQTSHSFLLLEADVPIASDQLKWEIRRVNSPDVLMKGIAPAPEPGGSLKLLLPASQISPGDYIVVIRSGQAAGAANPLMEATYSVRINRK
jgi:hypothetical protein